MADNPVPRVKLPDVPIRKPVQPGPNSWKQDQQKKAAEALGANNPGTMRLVADKPQVRDKINPTAPTFTPVLAPPKPRAYIRPATPLSPSGRTPRDIPTRAVTEPMAPKSFFRNRKGSISGLRKKPHQQDEVIKEESRLEAPLPPTPMPDPSSKAAELLGYRPANTDGKTLPASAPPTTSTPEPFRASNSGSGPSTLQNRQQSTPIPETPSRRWLIENGYSTSPAAPPLPTSPALSQQTHASALGGEHNQPKIEGMIVGDGKLSPTKQGSYGRMANVEVVEGPGRVASVRGVVEDTEQDRGDGGSSEQRNLSGSSKYSQQLSSVREHEQYTQPPHSATDTLVNPAGAHFSNQSDALMTLPSTVYSPNNYAGVWENNPRVVSCILFSRLFRSATNIFEGYSLPHFSPPPPRFPHNPEMQIRDQSINSMTSVPFVFRGSPDEITPHHVYPGSHASVNTVGTWVSDLRNSRNNSFAASPDPRMSTAMPPPLFTGGNNYVPPPSQHPDFQPSMAPPPPALAHLEMTLHHHIDSAFGSLMRTVNDKHERSMDEMNRKFEAMEEKFERDLKHQVADKLVTVRKDIKTLTQTVDGVATTVNETKDSVKGVDDAMKKLDKTVEETHCKCEHHLPSGNATGRNYIGYERGAGASERGPEIRGMETTHHPYNHQHQQLQHHHQQHPANPTISRPPTAGRHSANSNPTQTTTRRSNTFSASDDNTGRPSGERSGRRAYFAEMGRPIGPEPDLRAHPAFAGGAAGMGVPSQDQVWPHVYGREESAGDGQVLYQVPAFSGGAWYQQAYGG